MPSPFLGPPLSQENEYIMGTKSILLLPDYMWLCTCYIFRAVGTPVKEIKPIGFSLIQGVVYYEKRIWVIMNLLGKVRNCHACRNIWSNGAMAPPYFGIWPAISKTVSKRLVDKWFNSYRKFAVSTIFKTISRRVA